MLFLCRNGCFASGLFCCCALVLEKLKCEQEVDVFYATRIVRENRPQFIVDSVSAVFFIRLPVLERRVLTEDGGVSMSFTEKSGLP